LLVRSALGEGSAVAALLEEIDTTPGIGDNQNYPAHLPAMVRTALVLGDPGLAGRLAGRVDPRGPYAEHALAAANAALTENRGDLEAGA
jgi:hypothetical protein